MGEAVRPEYSDAFSIVMGPDDVVITFVRQTPMLGLNTNVGPGDPMLVPKAINFDQVGMIYMTLDTAKSLGEKLVEEVRKREQMVARRPA